MVSPIYSNRLEETIRINGHTTEFSWDIIQSELYLSGALYVNKTRSLPVFSSTRKPPFSRPWEIQNISGLIYNDVNLLRLFFVWISTHHMSYPLGVHSYVCPKKIQVCRENRKHVDSTFTPIAVAKNRYIRCIIQVSRTYAISVLQVRMCKRISTS